MNIRARERLAVNLTDTSKAYGYTLSVWGSGAVAIAAYSLPTPLQAAIFVLGAVSGFGLLSLVVYGTLFTDVDDIRDQQLLVASMVHYVAATGTVALAYGITALISSPLWGFSLVGLNTTLAYNVLLLVEAVLFEELRALEQWLLVRVR